MSVVYRVILSDDPYCPQCGHNRDTSSVSTIDHGLGIKECQMCGARWVELPRPSPDASD